MFFSTGIDILEVSKVQNFLCKHKKYLNEVFTLTEIEYCRKKRHQFQHFAARFAAKEAMFKALGIGWFGGLKWIDIEIINNGLGRPKVNLYGEVWKITEKMNIKGISISLSRCSEYAVAQVILMWGG